MLVNGYGSDKRENRFRNQSLAPSCIFCHHVTSNMKILSITLYFTVSIKFDESIELFRKPNRLLDRRKPTYVSFRSDEIARKSCDRVLLAIFSSIYDGCRQLLTLSSPVVPNGYTTKCSKPYWSNPPFLFFWRSGTLALSPELERVNSGSSRCKIALQSQRHVL